MSPLRDLDERLVPALARALRSSGRRLRRGAALATGGPALRRLDRRFASSGPLGFVREVPQVGVLVVASVFVAGALSAAQLQPPRDQPGAAGGERALVLGPAPGQDVAAWASSARDRLVRTAAARPGARYVALVVLSGYRPVADVQLDPGLAVRRAYLRAPGVDGAEVQEVPVPGPADPALLPRSCAATAARKVSDAQDLRRLADSTDPAVTALAQQREDVSGQAAREEAEAAAYRDPCRTLFAVLVEADAGRLRALLAREGVRGVELARAGAQASAVRARPVAPEVTGAVPSAAS